MGMLPAHIPFEFITHARKVKNLYKRALRNVYANESYRQQLRINCVLMRQRFEEHKNVKDPIKARDLLRAGEEEYQREHNPNKIIFSESEGGIAYDREPVTSPDWVLDYWHPLEKAMYPDYFARREQRKKEYVEWYDKKYAGFTTKNDDH